MFLLPGSVRIFLATSPVDMRSGFDRLGRAISDMGMDVYSGHLFAFVSRRGDRIKVLAWDHGGFVLWYKRLERGRFKLPARVDGDATVTLDGPSLAMLLDGIDYSRVRRPVHWRPKSQQEDRHIARSVIEANHVAQGVRQAGSRVAGDDAGPAGDHCGPQG